MVSEGSKATDIAIRMKIDGREPVLGKRGRVLGLNSSKKRYGMKKITKEQEKGRRGTRCLWSIQIYPMKVVAWNIRETGCPDFVSQVRKLSKDLTPNIVFFIWNES